MYQPIGGLGVDHRDRARRGGADVVDHGVAECRRDDHDVDVAEPGVAGGELEHAELACLGRSGGLGDVAADALTDDDRHHRRVGQPTIDRGGPARAEAPEDVVHIAEQARRSWPGDRRRRPRRHACSRTHRVTELARRLEPLRRFVGETDFDDLLPVDPQLAAPFGEQGPPLAVHPRHVAQRRRAGTGVCR